MADTTRTNDVLGLYLFPPTVAEDTAGEHRDWMNAQTQATLEKIESGKMTFKTLDEVRAKFGLDAR